MSGLWERYKLISNEVSSLRHGIAALAQGVCSGQLSEDPLLGHPPDHSLLSVYTDIGILGKMDELRSLKLHRHNPIPVAKIEMLKKTLPNCEIEF